MFKPVRMTRLVMGGHKDHMEPLIGLLHQEGVVHLEDYLDPTGTTAIGTPLEQGDRDSALLVRVRGLLNAMDAHDLPARKLATDHPETILQEAESVVLPVVDALAEARAERSRIQSEEALLRPYQELDIDLSLLAGLKSVKGYIGTAREDPVPALEGAGVPAEAQTAPAEGRVALTVFVPTEKGAIADRVLAEAGFAPASLLEVPGTPRQRLADLAHDRQALDRRIRDLEEERRALVHGQGARLASLERFLAQEVDKTQAPLRFRVTGTTFHAEGWVPRPHAERLRQKVEDRFSNSIYYVDLGDAPRDPPGEEHGGAHGDHEADASADHHDPEPEDEAPVKLANRGQPRHFEFLLDLLGRPRYKEIDPTKLMFIFFPIFFGLMVGDVVVGLAIVVLGLVLKEHRIFGIGGPAVSRILVLGGVASVLVGLVVFGEALGIHFVVSDADWEAGEPSWEKILGADWSGGRFIYKTGGHDAATGVAGESLAAYGLHAVAAEEGASPFKPHGDTHLTVNGWFDLGYYSKVHDVEALLLWSVVIGYLHIFLALLIGFRNVSVAHGMTLAVQEKLSWLLIMTSVPAAVLAWMAGQLVLVAVGVGVFVMSVALLWMGTQKVLGVGFISLLEIPGLMGNILSYTRIAAIGAGKAGIVIALIQIGFVTVGGADGVPDFRSALGWLIYIVGMAAVTLLAVLSGGLQSLRLQFVEFFQKFFTGGGRPYVPFGRRAP